MSMILHIPLIDDDGDAVNPDTVLKRIAGHAHVLAHRIGGCMPFRVLIVKVARILLLDVRGLALRFKVGAIHFGDTVARVVRAVRAVMPVFEDTGFGVYFQGGH